MTTIKTRDYSRAGERRTVQGDLFATDEVLAARKAGRNAECELVGGCNGHGVSDAKAGAISLLTLEREVQGARLAVSASSERRSVLPDLEPRLTSSGIVRVRLRARCRHVR